MTQRQFKGNTDNVRIRRLEDVRFEMLIGVRLGCHRCPVEFFTVRTVAAEVGRRKSKTAVGTKLPIAMAVWWLAHKNGGFDVLFTL
jgi:hypothetical protein